MLDPNYRNWSRDQIDDEISRKQDYIATLVDSIDYHREEYRRFPEGGYGARDLETALAREREEVAMLREAKRYAQ
jgi:hypothetical protein